MKIKHVVILIAFLNFCTMTFAKDTRHDKFEKILEKRTEYMISNVGLTKEEAKEFIPLYKEYQEKRMNLFDRDKNHDLHKKEKKDYTEEDFKLKNESYINNRLNKAILDRFYYEKFKKILPENKIYKLFQAEKTYKHELLKEIENKGRKH